MTILLNCILAFLELTFIFSSLLILHGMRKVIGITGFYISLGLIFVFMQIAGIAGFRITTGLPGLNFDMMSTGLLLPFLGALIVIYISDGTLEAQRVIVGMIATLGIYVYLVKLSGFESLAGEAETTKDIGLLMNLSLRSMAASVIAFSLDIFIIPIVYQALKNMRCRLIFSVAGALVCAQLCDNMTFAIIRYLGSTDWLKFITQSYLANMIAILWISIMSSFYLWKVNKGDLWKERGILDIIGVFFGNYGKAKLLEENLKKSEERYRLLFENANDMVAVIDNNGTILNANRSTYVLLGITPLTPLQQFNFQNLADVSPETWLAASEFNDTQHVITAVMLKTGRKVELTFSCFNPGGDLPTEYIVFGRDVSEKTKLQDQIEKLRAKKEHEQRLESIGRLAGGIAHDFNNYLHAIRGHLDLIRYIHPVEDEKVNQSLEKIEGITEKAAFLTQQMLGFARKGNYEKSILDPAQLLKATIEMFSTSNRTIPIETIGIRTPSIFLIEADAIQIQQAILNILINARDAMADLPDNDKKLTIRLGNADEIPGFVQNPPREITVDPKKQYCVIQISDSGPGIPEHIKNQILEPLVKFAHENDIRVCFNAGTTSIKQGFDYIKKILSTVRKADEMFNLIDNGDVIGVGISGGKDSVLLLYTLRLYQFLAEKSLNKKFDIIGIHINLNFGEEDTKDIKKFFKGLTHAKSYRMELAIKLHAMTLVRPNELRQAEWSEIDFNANTWTIPAYKSKNG